MYFFGLSKEEVLSQKHVVSYKQTSKQNPIRMVTLFGKQVYPSKSEDIDLRLPADHYASKSKEAPTTYWNGKRNPKIVIDLEEPPPTTEEDDDDIDKTSNEEQCLLDLNTTPADELVPEPRYCFSQDLNCAYIEEAETSCEKSGIDDDPTPLCSPKSQEKDGTSSPDSYTSCCTIENNLRTESRRSSSPRALEPSCRTRLEFLEEEKSSEMIQTAAESLVHISMISYRNQDNSSSQDQEFSDKPEAGKAERVCSCDSYELETLGINETNIEEDLCVTSMAQDELNNITRGNSKEIGLKLRRGRRMKNFQKEILPSLTSLSRHEIREDINILEAVLRSREYKRMQGKTKDVKFRANARNKRSVSQRNVGRKRRKTE